MFYSSHVIIQILKLVRKRDYGNNYICSSSCFQSASYSPGTKKLLDHNFPCAKLVCVGKVNDTPFAQGHTVSTLDKSLRLLSEINERKNKKNSVEVPEG